MSVCRRLLSPDLARLQAMRRFVYLDSLRGWLAVGVVAYHCKLSHYFPWYWGAMDVFFVMSGLLITRTLIQLQQKDRSLSRFFVYRVARLLPGMAIVVVAYWLLLPVVGDGQSATDVLPYVFLYQNLDLLLFGAETFPRVEMFTHMWSLLIEEHFYLVWSVLGLAFVIGRRPAVSRILGGVTILVLLAILCRMHGVHWWVVFGRLDGFAVGSAMGLLIFSPIHVNFSSSALRGLVVGFVVLCLLSAARLLHSGYLAYTDLAGYTLGATFWLDIPAFCILACALIWVLMVVDNGRESHALFQRVGRYFGNISYELYLFHVPVVVMLRKAVVIDVTGKNFLIFLLTLGITTLLAAMVSRYVSIPVLRRREELFRLFVAVKNPAQRRSQAAKLAEK